MENAKFFVKKNVFFVEEKVEWDDYLREGIYDSNFFYYTLGIGILIYVFMSVCCI